MCRTFDSEATNKMAIIGNTTIFDLLINMTYWYETGIIDLNLRNLQLFCLKIYPDALGHGKKKVQRLFRIFIKDIDHG